MEVSIKFNLNGKPVNIQTDSERSLLWVLRTELQMTGVKYGCGEGHCGACTVLINDRAARSCQFPVKNVAGKNVVTIEGLTQNGSLHPIQKAFMEHEALQCGFCTPGMILNAWSLLHKNPQPSKADIIDGMEDVLCRCGSHQRIIAAIMSAANEMKGGVK